MAGSGSSWPNLRAAFRWAADHDDHRHRGDDRDICAAFVGTLVEQYEPLAWAEETHRTRAEPFNIAAWWRYT